MRLALVCGLAEMLTVAAIRDATPTDGPITLCLYGKPRSMPDDLRRQSLEDAYLFGPWAQIVDAVGAEPFEALSGLRPDSILTHSLSGPFELAVFDLFPHAAITVFDNGLASHVDRPVTDDPARDRLAVAPGALARVERAWLTLMDVLPLPAHLNAIPVSAVPIVQFRGVAQTALARMSPSERPLGGLPARLILGTAFYRIGAISWEDERELYRSLAQQLRAESDTPILYKEHPRANREPLLSGADGVEVVQSRMPVEVWAEARPIIEAYSMSSTALLTLARLYGCHTRTVGTEVVMPKRLSHIQLLRDAVPAWRP